MAAVADRKHKKDVASAIQNPDPKYGGHLSDDSIGMLSLSLKARSGVPDCVTIKWHADLVDSSNWGLRMMWHQL
jgi:hypothetical protein